MARRPLSREDFEIAIICALTLEYDAVSLLFDEFWDDGGDQFGRAPGDPNNYTTGRVGKYNVVLALLPNIGKANAASAAASIRSSFGRLQLALLVGICGGVPRAGNVDDEILLGDVIISKKIIQHDFGRQYPDRFIRKDTDDNNSGLNKDVRNLLAPFETSRGRARLQRRTADFLKRLQATAAQTKCGYKYKYPGAVEDKLFKSSYRHKHGVSSSCVCSKCYNNFDPICEQALKLSCNDLGCDETYLVPRRRLEAKRNLEQEKAGEAQDPAIHIGSIASGDTVMKSGEDRDRIAERGGVIAYEMEGVGFWQEVPSIIIKGVSDYADCHKHKKWQNFGAATAASAMKALLEARVQNDQSRRVANSDGKCQFPRYCELDLC